MTRRSGLGRGLDALLPAADAPAERDAPRAVPVEAIVSNPRQPRQEFPDEGLAELAASIANLGVLQPVLVRVIGGGRYELIAGERRVRAAARAGLDRVPVVVVETGEEGALERALVENIHREDLNPIEEATAYRALMQEAHLTQEALASRLGRNRVTITNTLRLLDLPLEIQRLVVERRLSAGHGRALLGLEGNPFQGRLARRAAEEALSVRETEDLVRRYREMSEGARGAGPGGRTATPPAAAEAQRRLADRLQARVRVEVGKRKGKIIIDFASLDELERLTGTMLGESAAAEPARADPRWSV